MNKQSSEPAEQAAERKPYAEPELIEYGAVEELTRETLPGDEPIITAS